MKQETDQGFTLIELSIVLVIIGLIVGGVLVGQDLIKAAAVRAEISQIEKLNTAVNTFRDKYGGLPGDLNIASATQFGFNVGAGCTGSPGQRDGNGLLDGGASPYLYFQGVGETSLFWEDLSDAKLLEGFTSPTITCNNAPSIPGNATIDQYYPAAKIGSSNYLYVYDYQGANWFGLSAIQGIGGGASPISGVSLTVTQASSIDTKVDDGKPNTGNVQANYLCCTANTGVNQAPWTNLDDVGDTPGTCYSMSYANNFNAHYSTMVNNGADPNCALSFRFQ